jgi:neutral trehalase
MKPSVSTPEPGLDATFDHILEYWPVLTRRGESLAFPLSGRFVKPGGIFKWFFYWDSYFTLLGLVVQGKWRLAREMVESFIAEISCLLRISLGGGGGSGSGSAPRRASTRL